MRTIKFRGQTTIGKKWVTGHLVYWGGNYQIWETEQDGETHNYQVIPESVGQFTGLTDKNGKDIYEGDIVHYEGITSNGNPVIRKVVYNSERAQFMAEMYQIACPSMAKCTIIGNIHDNPELLS